MAVTWSVFTLIEHLVDDPVVWLPELWTGQIVICAMLATIIGLIGLTPVGAMAAEPEPDPLDARPEPEPTLSASGLSR